MLRITLLHLAILALCFYIFSSCKKDNNPVGESPSNGTNSIFPVKIGNLWISKVTEFDTTGVTIRTFLDTTTIVQDTLIYGEKWYLRGSTHYLLSPHYFTIRSNGIWALDLALQDPQPELAVKYPGVVGDSWNYRIPGGGPDSMRYTIVSTSVPVTVPSGNYTCYFYRLTEQTSPTHFKAEDYLAPGVGLVLDEYFDPTASGQLYKKRRTELISYVLQ